MAAVSVRAARENLARVVARVEAWRAGGQRDSYAATPPPTRAELAAVAAYQSALAAAYDDWLAAAWPQLAEAEDADTDREELLAALLLLLLTRLQRVAATHLPAALAVGVGKVNGAVTTTAMLTTVADALTANNAYLTTSLIPAIEAKLRAALLAGGEDLAANLRAALGSFAARVGQYAGELWTTIQRITGLAVDERGKVGGPDAPVDTRLYAILDPDAHHCSECPQFHSERGTEYESFEAYLEATGGRVPGEFQCGGNCRCRLEAAVD